MIENVQTIQRAIYFFHEYAAKYHEVVEVDNKDDTAAPRVALVDRQKWFKSTDFPRWEEWRDQKVEVAAFRMRAVKGISFSGLIEKIQLFDVVNGKEKSYGTFDLESERGRTKLKALLDERQVAFHYNMPVSVAWRTGRGMSGCELIL
jgi:hypothetical protein